MTRHERLRKRLARLEPRRRGGRTKQQSALRRKPIGDAETQRNLGPDDGDIDLFARRKIQQRVDVAHVGRNRPRKPRNSRIPRRDDELADIAVGGQPRRQRMLTRAAADDENSHLLNELGRATTTARGSP